MTSKIRIGQGSDVHQLVVGRDLIVGGVAVSYTHLTLPTKRIG